MSDKRKDSTSRKFLLNQARVDKTSNQYEKSRSSFSDIYFTIDKSQNIRFVFHADLHQIIKKTCSFPGLLDIMQSRNPDFYRSIIDTEKIIQVRMFRKQIKNINRLSSGSRNARVGEDIASQEELIYESDGSGLYNSLPYTRRKESKINKNSIISYLVEAPVNMATGLNIKTLTGTDFEISRKNAGHYEYRIELEVFDPTVAFMRNILSKISSIMHGNGIMDPTVPNDPGLIGYYENSKLKRYHTRSETGRFPYSFYSYYKKNYPYTPGEGNSDFIFVKIKEFVNLVSYVYSSMKVDQLTELYEYMITACSPVTGNQDGVSKVINMITDFEQKIISLLRTSVGKKSIKDVSNSQLGTTPNLQAGKNNRTSKVSHIFDNKLDMSKIKSQRYYDYLSIEKLNQAPNPDGLCLFSSKDYVERTRLELAKYFTKETGPIDMIDNLGKNVTRNDTAQSSRYSFLSPARIMKINNGRLDCLELLNGGELNQNRESQNRALNEIMNLNLGKKINNFFVSSEEQYQNSELSQEFLALSGVTIRDNTHSDKVEKRDGDRKVDAMSKKGSNYQNIFNDDKTIFERYEDRVKETNHRAEKIISSISSLSNKFLFKDYNDDKFYDISGPQEGSNIRNFLNKYKDTDSTIKRFPNHLKAMLLGSLNSETVKENSIMRIPEVTQASQGNNAIPMNSLRDIKNQGYLFFNYKSIQRIQVLRTFESDDYGFQIESPVWEDLKQIDLNRSSNSILLCRMVTYINKECGYERDDSLKLPIFNEVFFLDISKKSYQTDPIGKTTISGGRYRRPNTNVGNSSFHNLLNSSIDEISQGRASYLESKNQNQFIGTEFSQTNNMIRMKQDTLGAGNYPVPYTKAFKMTFLNRYSQMDRSEITKILLARGYSDAIENSIFRPRQTTRRNFTQSGGRPMGNQPSVGQRSPTAPGRGASSRRQMSTNVPRGSGGTTGGGTGGGGGSTY